MPFTNFPNGVTSFGIPVLGNNPISIPNLNGTVWFVDGANGNNGNDGLSPSSAFGTISKAVTQAKSGTGDTIVIYPGTYAENVVVTGKNNISFVSAYVYGVSSTGGRPGIKPASGVPLTLNQCTGLYFNNIGINAVGATTVGMLTDSNSCVFNNCHFIATGSGVKFLAATAIAFDGSGTTFENCIFSGCVNGIKCFVATVGSGTQASNCVVESCEFYGNSGADISDDGTANVFWAGWQILGNQFSTKAKTVYLAMSAAGGQTTTNLMIAGNYFGATATMTTTMIALETGSSFAGNFSTIGVVDGHTF